jgi:nifR3 family TIM-barrel protein
MLQIGPLTLENRFIMAPMAGITNLPFRLILKQMGAALVSTEMISAEGLVRRQKKTLHYMKTLPEEKPLAMQIFGTNPVNMAKAAEIVIEAGADIVDINLGCPVKKVVKTGAGSALLKNPRQVEKILKTLRPVCSVPLTIKIRAGWSPQSENAVEIALLAEGCGVDALTLHARFADQGFSGRADWDIIGRVKRAVKIPVIGNGDVFEPSQALNLRRRTGCDGVMIGRGAINHPWIFRQIHSLEKGLSYKPPTLEERKCLIQKHYQLLARETGSHRAALLMRRILLWYTKGMPNSSRFREQAGKINDLDSLLALMENHFYTLKEERQ